MSNLWFASDTHFAHKNIVNFADRENGYRIRPYADVDEHDEALIKNWNDVVRSNDTVYHLGDVAINKRGIDLVSRLNGRKILLRGNHDIFDSDLYRKAFADIRAYKVFTELKWIASHIPIHKECIERWVLNIHGHLHSNVINDPEYLNVSMEQIQMAPISIEEIKNRAILNRDIFNERGKVFNFFHVHYESTYGNK